LKLTGERETFNAVAKKYEKIKVEKEYYDEESYREIIETVGEEKTISTLPDGAIPFVILQTRYNLNNLLAKTDKINEKNAWGNNIFEIHGNPALVGEGMNQQQNPEKEDKTKHNKGYKLFKLPADASMKFLEMSGGVATLMLNNVETLKAEISTQYPEYDLAGILSADNISENTSTIKFTEIEKKVQSFRADMAAGLTQLVKMGLEREGKSPGKLEVVYGDIFAKNDLVESKSTAETEEVIQRVIGQYIGNNDLIGLNVFLKSIKRDPYEQPAFDLLTKEVI